MKLLVSWARDFVDVNASAEEIADKLRTRGFDVASVGYVAPLLKKEDGKIDWSLAAQKIYNRIRGLQPWPGAFTSFRGKNCHVWGRPVTQQPLYAEPGTLSAQGQDFLVACGETTALRLESVQLEGRKRVSAREFANGARLVPGERFLY